MIAPEGPADRFPAGPGAYALTFRLEEPLALPIARLNRPVLDPGLYVYAGSAFGPGGLRECIDVKTYPGGRECALVADLLTAGATVPVPGFGSSDCRDCAAHLVRLAD